MTLCEYSMDYGDETFKEKAANLIKKEILNISNDVVRNKTIDNIKKIRCGNERDFYV